MLAVRGWDLGGCVLASVLCGASCLNGPPPDDVSDSSPSTSASVASTAVTTGPPSESSTGAGETSTSSTTDPGTTSGASHCGDGIYNGDETDVDCGGSCIGCSEGQTCKDANDCNTGMCGAFVCVVPACLDDADCGVFSGSCTKGVCDLNTNTCLPEATNEGGTCEDSDLCTSNEICIAGVCSAGETLDCSELDSPCTFGKCDPNSGSCGFFNKEDGLACDDGDGCTFNEACVGGNCIAPANEGAIYFTDFSSIAGWNLQAPWEIGPAKASVNGTSGADPASDYSSSDDNGVAGTAIGGLDNLGVHGPLCLTSPSFDTSAFNDALWVSFWRHLHSPASTSVINRIEVWNGVAWKLVETGYPSVTNDNAWTFQKYNATGNAAKDFRVRICVERKQGAPDYAGWSIDDFAVASSACTP